MLTAVDRDREPEQRTARETEQRIDELVAGIHLAGDSAALRGDTDLATGLRLLARVGEDLADVARCTCPSSAHAIGCPELEAARDLAIAALTDQGLGELATLIAIVLSPAPLTEAATDALGAVRVAFGGAR